MLQALSDMDIRLQTNVENSVLEFLTAERYGDGSGYGATIYMNSSGFSARVFCTFGPWPMSQFVAGLERLDAELKGEAILKPEYDHWHLKFSAISTGKIVVSGVLYQAEQELSFSFTTDQTCLKQLILDLRLWQSQTST